MGMVAVSRKEVLARQRNAASIARTARYQTMRRPFSRVQRSTQQNSPASRIKSVRRSVFAAAQTKRATRRTRVGQGSRQAIRQTPAQLTKARMKSASRLQAPVCGEKQKKIKKPNGP